MAVQIQTGGKVVDKDGVFHIIKELVGFVLYMHQQIPQTLQQLEMEFANLKLEREGIVCQSTKTETQCKPSSQRQMIRKLRKTKRAIKKIEKLITSISNLLSSVQAMVYEVPEIQVVLLALGSSPTRPQHVYEIQFLCKESVPEMVEISSGGKKARADVLSKKIIRELISNGAGCMGTYSGPTKLFLLIKAPATIKLPEGFLPKRDYMYSRKVNPVRVHVTSCYGNKEAENSSQSSQANMSIRLDPEIITPCADESIWFLCRHNVKGFACQDDQC